MDKENFVINRLLMLCVKYCQIMVQENVWQLDTLLDIVWNSLHPYSETVIYAAENSPGKDEQIAMLLEELRITYERLEELGISKEMARKMLWERENISRMYVCADGMIVLPDYNTEVCLTPLQWALYVLFLRHDEGIDYKCLPGYRDELFGILTGIVKNIDGMFNQRRVKEMVERVTDPKGKSINEIVSKIRRAFIDATGSVERARHYYINGTRGELRRIPLDRAFVYEE